MTDSIDLGPWTVDVDEDQVGQALAAIGVVAAHAAGRVSLGEILASVSDSRVLPGLLDRRSPVPCRLTLLTKARPRLWSRAVAAYPATEVARSWATVVGERSPEDRVRLAVERLDGDLGLHRWVTDRLLRPGVGAAPSFPAPELVSPTVWQWPLRVGLFGDPDSVALRGRLGPQAWSAPLYRIVDLEREPVADLALWPGTLQSALASLAAHRDQLEVGVVVVLGGLGATLGARVEDILGALRLRSRPWGLALADLPEDATGRWLEDLLFTLSHDTTLDLALRAALSDHAPWLLFAEPGGLEASRVSRAATSVVAELAADRLTSAELLDFEPQSFGLPTEPSVDELREAVADRRYYHHETAGATAGAMLARAAVARRRERPVEAEPRWIQAEVRSGARFRSAPRRGALTPSTLHGIDVWIGPESGAIRAEGVFPDALLPADRRTHRLSVVFAELDGSGRTTSGQIALPPTGTSSRQRFWFRTPADGEFRARIIVAYRNRILQTALLIAPVGVPRRGRVHRRIRLSVEAAVRPAFVDLASRRRFGAAIVHNHLPGGSPAATMLHGAHAAPLRLDGIGPAVTSISQAISDAAFNPESYGPGLDAPATVNLLYRLAQQGVLFHQGLMKLPTFSAFVASAERIQVVAADPNAVLPLEFVYELKTPARPAKLCENARRALLDGRCQERFHHEDEEGHLDVVCPSGFWGISRVIERHVADTEGVSRSGATYLVTAEPTKDRDTLGGLTGAVFAASARVDQVVATSTATVEAVLGDATGGRAARVRTWLDWVRRVGSEAPSLLVLLAHSAQDELSGTGALEIETDERRSPGDITTKYVRPDDDRAAPPIVLLMGCDTAVPEMQYQTFVTQFRDCGAALVVGTIATVAGSHAAGVTSALVKALTSIGSDEPPAFGDLLRQVRRRLLAEGEVMALALTAYGDADWRFPVGR